MVGSDRAGLSLRRCMLCSGMGALFVMSAGVQAAGEQGGPRDFAETRRMERVIPAGGSIVPMRRFDGEPSPEARRIGYGEQRGPGLTPEERRQLRRDIRDAARELYRDAPER